MQEFHIIGWGFIILFAWFLASRTRKKTTDTPLTNEMRKDKFLSSLPTGFGYEYFLNNTGFALNMETKQIAFTSDGNLHIYSFSDIRDIEKKWVIPTLLSPRLGSNMKTDMAIANMNSANTISAYNTSGLFVSIADIQHPVHQVKFTIRSDMDTAYEILTQALEEKLPHTPSAL